jgi:hypothetical protein
MKDKQYEFNFDKECERSWAKATSSTCGAP